MNLDPNHWLRYGRYQHRVPLADSVRHGGAEP